MAFFHVVEIKPWQTSSTCDNELHLFFYSVYKTWFKSPYKTWLFSSQLSSLQYFSKYSISKLSSYKLSKLFCRQNTNHEIPVFKQRNPLIHNCRFLSFLQCVRSICFIIFFFIAKASIPFNGDIMRIASSGKLKGWWRQERVRKTWKLFLS